MAVALVIAALPGTELAPMQDMKMTARFLAPLTHETASGRVGIAAWTSEDPVTLPGRAGGGAKVGAIGLSAAIEWGTSRTKRSAPSR